MTKIIFRLKSIIIFLFIGLIPFDSNDALGKDIVSGLNENCEPSTGAERNIGWNLLKKSINQSYQFNLLVK